MQNDTYTYTNIPKETLCIHLTSLKGIGEKRARLFAKKGLLSISDLLFFSPIHYEDRTKIYPIKHCEENSAALVKGRVVFGKEERFYPGHKRLFKITINDKENNLDLVWFHYKKQHLTKLNTPDIELLAFGKITINRGRKQMVHPDITVMKNGDLDNILGFYPVYSSIKGISPNMLRSIVRNAVISHVSSVIDPVPQNITLKLGLPDLASTIKHIHFPHKDVSLNELNLFNTPFHRRLLFNRFFLVMLMIAHRKKYIQRKGSPSLYVPSSLFENLKEFFPFSLTSHQFKAIKDIVHDLKGSKHMRRLIMGDVGCGKTVVAAVATYITINNNMQVALLAPTQVLAEQHMEYFSTLPKKMAVRPVLLTGQLNMSERKVKAEEIKKGEYNMIIGTQSLIQEKMAFCKLGLVVIDEQHKFGVRERAMMEMKGKNPHLLVMSATPIPRTLAIAIYGDMDISTIQEYPEKHLRAVTHIVMEHKKRQVFNLLNERISKGQQAFVICPVIERSEELDLKNAIEMAEKLKKILPFRIGLVHGRMTANEKSKVMGNFRRGMIDMLVGTTVIEVGVHVPNATIMIIEQPERFGLSQLHQLRGRVGRGDKKGICILMASNDLPEKTLSRLKVLVETEDGFEIAQKDLALRGQGELIGIRQTGPGEIDFAEIAKEPKLLLDAKKEAQRLIESDPELLLPEHQNLKKMMHSTLKITVDL